MAFPNLLKRLFDSNGAGVKLNGGIMPYSTSSPKAASTASPGTSDTVARGDHIHPAQTAISGNAGTATKLKNKRTIDGVQFDGSANVHHYGSCSTAAGTAEKAVTLAGFTLATGARITVRFTVTNTAANPTLNVNSTGAKPIQYRNAAISAAYLAANRVYEFVYDGAAWELVGDINTDTNTTYGAASAAPKAPGTAGSALAALLAPLLFLPLPLWGRLLFLAVIVVTGGLAATRAEILLGRTDPGEVVIDELVGVWIALLPLGAGQWSWPGLVWAFALFRLFDIWKPWPVHASENWLPAGWGIMLDDILAGLMAMCCMLVLRALGWV